MKHQRAIVLGAGAAIATGIILGRRFTPSARLNRLLNGNLKLFPTRSDRHALQTLASGNKSYLLRGWPRPGINDSAKRQLLVTASSESSSENDDQQQQQQQIESTRIAVLQAPICDARPHTLTTHSDTRIDDFYWLRDDDRKNKEVIAHLNAENNYTKHVLADTEPLQEALYKEMRGRIQEADQSAPQRYSSASTLQGYWYYTRTEEGAQYAVHCRRSLSSTIQASPPSENDAMDTASAPEEIILDENEEAKGHDFYMVGGFQVSPNHKLVAYGVDLKGNESYELRVKDITTGKQLLEKPIPDTAGNFAWAADNKTLFYVTKDKLDRPFKVWRHILGSSVADELVYHEEDDAFYIGIDSSRSEKMLYIHSGSAVTSDVRMLSADNPMGAWSIVLPRKENVEYSVDDRGEQLFITIRDTERPNSEVLVAPISDPTAAKVIVPHRPDVKLGHIELSNEFLVAFERERGLQQAVVYSLPMTNDGKDPAPVVVAEKGTSPLGKGTPITFDEPAYELSGGSQGDFNSGLLRFHYTSLTTPDTVYDYNMKTGQRAVKKVQPVLGGFDQTKYKTERLWATATDGTQVPISIVYRTDLVKLDGSDPMLLDAYGSYEISNDADFRSSRLSLVDRGFVFGIAHVRGGGEMGRTWYEDGKYLKKMNTFTDFIASAELLISKKYTSKEKLAISGRSAGGLTMGAVINLRPDLFNAAILGVPFVDVLTTMLDHSIPLTTIEVEEWGDPAEKEYYEYMKSYSPIDNIKAGEEYPNMLVTGGLHDPRVGYWEPAKLVAKLRKLTAQGTGKMLLLKLEMGAGHFSQSGRFDKLKEVAQEHAFLLKCQGMLNTPLQTSGSKV